MLVFGSTKYRELAELQKRLKKVKTNDDKKRLLRQIDFLHGKIKKEENTAEEYFENK